MNPTTLRRRQVLTALSLIPAGHAFAGQAERFPPRVNLVVAGPIGSNLELLSRSLSEGLRNQLPTGTLVARQAVGGLDGVTGANEFTAQSSLDGGVALLVPGAASLAWLVGDTRVHFDPLQWLPIFAQTGPAVVLGHERTDALIQHSGVVRVASGGPISPALAAMLAIDLLGAQVRPVYGLEDENAALAALQRGNVDAVLTRRLWVSDAQSSPSPIIRPLFDCKEALGGQATPMDVPTQPVPTLRQYSARLRLHRPDGPRYDAWSCAARVAALRFALVLPGLTPPSAVALWRDAGAHAMLPGVSAATDLLDASAASVLLRSLSPGAAALLNLREWLADRLAWQPS